MYNYFQTLLGLVAFSGAVTAAGSRKENSDLPYDVNDDRIQVHIIPHTHDDIGWVQTVDEYHYSSTQYIIDGVVSSLLADPERKFMYVEQGFFVRWWDEQNEKTKKDVHHLVENKQLTFIVGGWCMNDEAAVHYNSIIDQHTLGHQFLKKEFNISPRIAWQIDPFGHSSTMASLSASMGMDAIIFSRLDHADNDKRKMDKTLNMVWTPSRALGKDNNIFTVQLPKGYGWPDGLDFDTGNIQDDPKLRGYNKDETVNLAVQRAKEYAAWQNNKHIFWPMGTDFKYVNAQRTFKNLDKLIKHVNKDGRVHLFYSNPEIYIDAINKLDLTHNTKKDDFFPYSDNEHSYWTGYFTSRAAFKRLERYGMALLQTCRQMEARQSAKTGKAINDSYVLAEPMGIAQHHDAISGTAKQYVSDDYTDRINVGINVCEKVANKYIEEFVGVKGAKLCRAIDNLSCKEMNFDNADSFKVIVYNPLGSSQECKKELIRVPIKYEFATVHLFDQQNKIGTLVDIHGMVRKENNNNQVQFHACVGATQASVFKIQKVDESSFQAIYNKKLNCNNKFCHTETENSMKMSNEKVAVTVDKKTGMLTHIHRGDNVLPVNQDFAYYRSSVGDAQSDQKSGAYIFRPIEQKYFSIVDGLAKITSDKDGIHVRVSKTVSQHIRLGIDDSVEVEMEVGPIDISDGIGKEYVVVYNTNIDSKSTFYTDSSGREMQKRVRDHRDTWDLNTAWEPISQNYYPINTRIVIKDEDDNESSTTRFFSLTTDRSCGGTSMKDGQVEVMLHRRTTMDDTRGVGEALNEMMTDASGNKIGLTVQIKQMISLDSTLAESRVRSHKQTFPMQVFYAPAAQESNFNYKDSLPMLTNLDSKLHLLTFQSIGDNTYLVRLDNIFSLEDGGVNVDVDIDSLFSVEFGTILKVEEMSLSANQLKSDIKRLKWNTSEQDKCPNENVNSDARVRRVVTMKNAAANDGITPINSHKYTIKPQEIKTFRIIFKKK